MSDQAPFPPTEEEFSPRGTLFLMVLFAVVFAAAWGFIYFGELLARR